MAEPIPDVRLKPQFAKFEWRRKLVHQQLVDAATASVGRLVCGEPLAADQVCTLAVDHTGGCQGEISPAVLWAGHGRASPI